MTRLELFCEDGNVLTELCEIKKVDTNEITKKGMFSVKEKPVYLQIKFNRPLDEEEIRSLYRLLLTYGLINIPENEIEAEIAKDLHTQELDARSTMGLWQIRCPKFLDAFNCGCSFLTCFSSRFDDDNAFNVMISDTPTDDMKGWLEKKNIKKIGGYLYGFNELDKFDTSFYESDVPLISKMDRIDELELCSQLLADMTARGALTSEINNIIMYSMVIIDASKKRLDWKQAAKDFRVREMLKKYGGTEPDEP